MVPFQKGPVLFLPISWATCIDICARSRTDVSQITPKVALTCGFEIVQLQVKSFQSWIQCDRGLKEVWGLWKNSMLQHSHGGFKPEN